MSITFSVQDKLTLRTGAYGAVSLLAAAGAVGGSAHKIATKGSIALASATGLVGHVLAEKTGGGMDLSGKSVAELADKVLPALTDSMSLLKAQAPAEADNYRGIVLVAIESALDDRPAGPVLADMIRKITAALDAA